MTNFKEFLAMFEDYHLTCGSTQSRFNAKFDSHLDEFLEKRNPDHAILLPSHIYLQVLENNLEEQKMLIETIKDYDIHLPTFENGTPSNLRAACEKPLGRRRDRLIKQELRYFKKPKDERPKFEKWVYPFRPLSKNEVWYFEAVLGNDPRVDLTGIVATHEKRLSKFISAPREPLYDLKLFVKDFYLFLYNFALVKPKTRYLVDARFAPLFNMHRTFWLFFDRSNTQDFYNNLSFFTHIVMNLFVTLPHMPLLTVAPMSVCVANGRVEYPTQFVNAMPPILDTLTSLVNMDIANIMWSSSIPELPDEYWNLPLPPPHHHPLEANLNLEEVYDDSVVTAFIEEEEIDISEFSQPQASLLSLFIPERVDTEEETTPIEKTPSYLETIAAGISTVRDGSLKETTDQMNNLLSQIANLMDKLKIENPETLSTIDQLRELLDTKKWKDSSQRFLVQVFSGVIFCGATISAINNRDKISIAVCLIAGGVFLYHTESFMNSKMVTTVAQCIEKVKNFLSNLNASEPQSFVADSPSIIKAVGTLFSMFVLKDTPINKLPEEVYRKISGWDRFTGNIHEIVMNLLSYVEWLYKYAQSYFFGTTSQERWFMTHSPEVEEHIAKAEAFLRKFHDGDMQETQFNFDTVSDLIKENNSILMNCKLPANKANDLRTVLNRFRMMLDAPFKKFSSSDYNAQGLRVEPVFVVMIGGPGTLKSSTTKMAVHAVMPYILTREELEAYQANPEAFVMFRKTHHTFWEALKNLTKMLVYDDGDQRVEVPGDPTSEALEVIEIVNNDTAPANMAFGDKGKRNIAPDIVWKTTNMKNPVLDTVHSKGAYYRRIDHAYIVYPREEYCNVETSTMDKMSRTIDTSLLPVDENGESVVHENMVWYQRVRYLKNYECVEEGTPITFNMMVEEVRATHSLKKRQYYKLKNRINEIRNYHVNRALESMPQAREEVIELNDLLYDLSTENGRYSPDFEEFYKDFEEMPISGDRRTIDQMEEMLDQKHIAEETFEYKNDPTTLRLTDECEHAVNAFVKNIYKRDYVTFLYLHMKRLYKVHNVWNMHTDVKAYEIVAAFYYRFGLKFNEVVISQDPDLARRFFLKIYQLYDPFVRPYVHLNGTGYEGVLIKLMQKYDHYKSSLKDKMKGTWAEGMYNSWLVIKEHTWMLQYLATLAALQLLFATFIKYTVTPSIKEFQEEIKRAEIELEIRKKMYEDLRKTFAESKSVIDMINKEASEAELKLYKKILENASKIPSSEWDSKLILVENKETKQLQVEPFVQDPNEGIDSLIQSVDEYIKDYSNQTIEPTIPQSHSDHPRGKARKYQNKNLKIKQQAASKPQMGDNMDKNGEDIMNRILCYNFFGMAVEVYPGSNEYESLGSMLFIKGSIAAFPDHFFDTIGKKIIAGSNFSADMNPLRCRVKIRLDYGDTHQAQYFYLEDFVNAEAHPVGEGKDQILVNTPIKTADFSCRKTIVKYIANREEHQNLGGLTAKFVANKDGTIEKALVRVQHEATHYVVPDPSDPSTAYELHNGYKYYAPTSTGDCGGLLFIQKPTLPRSRLIGMHVAGSEKICVGYSESLVREEIEEALAKFDTKDLITEEFEEPSRPQAYTLVSNGQIMPLYRTEQSAPMAFASDIRKSPLYNLYFPSKKIPAPLTPKVFNGVLTDTWNHNLKKMCVNRGAIPQVYVDAICKQIYVDLCKNSPISVKKFVLTPEQAFCGLEDEPDSRSLPRNTGIGWPECNQRVPDHPKRTRYTGKSQDGYDLDNKYWLEALEIIYKLIEDMANGVRDPENYNIDNVKDELIPREDVLNKLKARIFSVLRFLYIVIDKMYFGQFAMWIMKNRIHNGIAIGVNVYSEEWHMIAKRLLCFGVMMKNIGAGDYSGYDGSHRGQAIRALIIHVINAWYNDGNDRIRNTSGTYMYNAKHIRGNLVMEYFGGIPSGMFLTALINCLLNLFNFYYCWLVLHQFDLACLPKFDKHIKPVVQGDDNGYATSSLYREKFTEDFIGRTVIDLGYTYTPEHKNSPLASELRNLEDIEFLKRRFRYDKPSRRYDAALRLDSLLEQVYWTKKGEKSHKTTCDKVDSVILELSLHGEEVFNKYAPTLVQASYERLDHYPITDNYQLAKAIIASRENFI